ncbi:zinc finger protein DZIP1L isoform X1 [Strongylocentrotus purpuratus]|uniref:C2H2-type domain-containing protein n=1 Tax=Strongylocentrotus purpuratus TaxID=7668 RepID=A0A7M7SX51_STRPU|nr:zinc finger protein DZIP1L isoform X1 [Strongylocentrotus purpuratus]
MSVNMPFMPSPRGGLPHHGYTNGYAGGSGAQPHVAVGSVPGSGMQGFMFRSRNERIDWKKIASIDVDRIMRDLDVSSLQDSIMGITFCDIEREIDTRMVDQNFVMVFKLAQLIIQYLLHSQEVMAHNTSVAEERVQQFHVDHEATRMELSQVGEELQKVKQESHKRKKLLKNQQSLIQATANNYHKCMYCQKAFFNIAYLQSHMQRKHPEFTPRPPQVDDNITARKMNEVSEKLEKELDELRDRLKFSESQVAEERERAQEQIKMALQQKQNQGEAEKQEEHHRKELERWKHEQLSFQKVEMEKMQNMFMKELKEMHDKYTSSQTALENIQSKLGKQSMLGKIVDEDELEEYKRRSKKQEKEMGKLKEELQTEISTVQTQMATDLKRKEEEWRKKQKELRSSYKEEVKELKALLKQTKELLEIEREGGDKKGAKYQKQLQDLLKKNKDFERQLKGKEEKIKELKVKSSKHYEVVEPRSSPPSRMTIPTPSQMEPASDEEDTDQENSIEGMDTLSRVLQESESWLTGTHPSYNLPDSDIEDDELDGMNGHESQDKLHTFAKNKDRIMAGLKEELSGVLQKNMEKRGVPEGMRGISAQSLENKIRVLKQERQQLAKQHSKFYDIRERFKREIDRKAAEMRRSGSPVGKAGRSASPQPRLKAVTPPPRSHKVSSKGKPTGKQQQQQRNQQQQRQQPKQQQPKQRPQSAVKGLSPGQVRSGPPLAPRSPALNDRRSRGVSSKGRANTPKSNVRVSFEDESEEDDEEEDESEEEEESESFDDESEPEEHYKTPNVPPRPAAHNQPATNGFHHRNTEGDDDEEEDSEWDSEEISDLDEARPKPAPAPAARPITSVRQPQGQMVSSLTRSIELQLSGRQKGRKPVGGVDLGAGSAKPPQPAPRTPSPSPTPRIPTIPDAGLDDEFDDSGSLSVSSLGDSFSGSAQKATSPTPAPRTGKKSNDTDMSSNTYNTSMWGSSKAKGNGTGTGKSSLVSVTDFDDDDDDFDIDDLG